MTRLLLLLLLALPLVGRAATISSTSCTSGNTTGCILLPLNLYPNTNSVSVQVTGTWSGQLVFEGSNDGTTYVEIRAYPVGGGSYSPSISTNGIWSVSTAGLFYFRVRAAAWTSGTATVTPQPSASAVVVESGGGVGEVVDLGATTIDALGPQPLTVRAGDWVSITSASAAPVPANLPDGGSGALSERTEIRIVNASDTTEVVCDPPTADGGLPEWGVRGTPLFPSGGYATWKVADSVRVYCRAKSGTAVPVAPSEVAP